MISRVSLAAIVSPPAAMLGFWAAQLGAFLLTPGPAGPGAVEHTLFFFMFFGVPIAYLGAGLLALPAYQLLRRRNALRPTVVVLISGLLGAVWAMLVLGFVDRITIGELLGIAAVGTAGGVAGGATFVLVALVPWRSRPASWRHVEAVGRELDASACTPVGPAEPWRAPPSR